MGFEYKSDVFSLVNKESELSLLDVALKYQRPVYVYDVEQVRERLKLVNESMPGNSSIHYAMKANDNPYLLKMIAELGYGVDLVSGGELIHALECGFPANKIVFSGVGKSIAEIELAIEKQIKQINVESPEELLRIAKVAKQMGSKARVAFRMNPDVNPETHPYIKTGFRENKFGMDDSFIEELVTISNDHKDSIEVYGLTLHIGSQIREIEPFIEATQKTLKVFRSLNQRGFNLKTFDVGGGVGINYDSFDYSSEEASFKEYGVRLKEVLAPYVDEVLCEPGRFVVGHSGVLLTQVQYIKRSPYKTFAIVDSGMNHLMRPSLYQAHHNIVTVVNSDAHKELYDIVGPICESSDVLGYERLFSQLKEGDWLAVVDAGAYGAVMSSAYNLHDFPLEIVVDGHQEIVFEKKQVVRQL